MMRRLLILFALLWAAPVLAQPIQPPQNAAPLFGLPAQQGSSANPFVNISFTGQALGPLNCSTAPAYSFTALPTYGFGALGTTPCVVVAGTQTMGWTATSVTSTVPIAVASDSGTYALGAASDAILAWDAAAAWQLGVDAAGVTNQTLKGPDRITSDGVGGNLTIAGGRNRGASVGGSVIFQTAPAAGAGVTGTLATVLTLDSTRLATFTGNAVVPASGFLGFGGLTAGTVALKGSGSVLTSRFGDDSGYADVSARIFDAQTNGSTGQYRLNGAIAIISTAPTAAGTGMAFTVATGSTSFAWTITITTANTQSAFTLTLPTASNAWNCWAQSLTNPGSMKIAVSSRTTATNVLTQYSQTTGLAAAYADSNVLFGSCVAQ